MRIALIGYGAIGREVIGYLHPEIAAGTIELAGIVVRHPERYASPPPAGFVSIDEAVRADLVLECAGVAAARQHGPAVVAAGTALLITSIGVLADPVLERALLGGPGEVVLTSGAIGGLDLVRAAAQAGGLDRATITTTKTAGSLVQAWMDDATAARVRNLTEPELLFDGTPAEAIEKFPANVNVAIALGVAARGLGTIADGLAKVRVRIVADPRTETSTHVIEAAGSSGTYRFDISNHPSRANPRTSALTAQAVAADVRARIGRPTGAASGNAPPAAPAR
ncbi:aspartate dehydrogenase domain-containing protein [Agrococcus sp. Ld7]|uniref:aspartate dehydrogenase domain-containing protein n=1 Tax=Agrococcus sp. Ld7 TaxID=649148 RepID=UPI00386E763D